MTQPRRARPLPKPLLCAQQEFLRHLARVAGVDAVTLWAVGKKGYLLSVRMRGNTQEWCLATRREPREPRRFTRLDVAVRMGQRLFKVRSMTLMCQT